MNEKQVLDFLKANKKKIKAVYIGWAFIHLVFLLIGLNGAGHLIFFPFHYYDDSIYEKIAYAYDLSEFMVYVGTPAVVYFIYRLLNKKD